MLENVKNLVCLNTCTKILVWYLKFFWLDVHVI